MKKNKIIHFSGVIASTLLTVLICSIPLMAEAKTVWNQYTSKTAAQTEIPSQGAAVSGRTSNRSAYSQVIAGTVNVPLSTGGTMIFRVPAVSGKMTEAQTVRNQATQKPAAQTVIPNPDTAVSTHTSNRSAYSQVRTSIMTVTLPTGETMTYSVPVISGGNTLTGSQLNMTAGKTVVRETGSSSSLPVNSGIKTAAMFNSSSLTVHTSKGRVMPAPAVKTGGQPTKSNSNGGGLCLVALGLQLNPDGSMQQELIGRLEALKIAAQKNPQAIIVCTGGHTAVNNRSVSEAGQMAQWLRENGIDPDRILVESKALSTQDNAVYTLELLKQYHPEVSQIAIITSDYHMNDGVQLFTAQAARMGGGITVTAGKAWSTQ